jgi:putative intracellular protease/amidase
MATTNRILTIVTNVGEYDKVGYRTGLWLGELIHFWDVAEEAGYQLDIASPRGGYVPIDPESLMAQELGHAIGFPGKVHKRYESRAFMDRLVDAKKVSDADAGAYDAIYLTGGHGVCFDFAESAPLAALVASFYEAGKIVSAVCHGPAGLLQAKLTDGRYLLQGKRVTGFSWKEEVLAKRDKAVPYNLEEEIKKRGARYESGIPFARFIQTDGLLITGQNPASAGAVGKAVIHALGGGAAQRRAG